MSIYRVTITFYWPWARLGSMVRSRMAKADNHVQTIAIQAENSGQTSAASEKSRDVAKKSKVKSGESRCSSSLPFLLYHARLFFSADVITIL